jgi:hypothetical protein
MCDIVHDYLGRDVYTIQFAAYEGQFAIRGVAPLAQLVLCLRSQDLRTQSVTRAFVD